MYKRTNGWYVCQVCGEEFFDHHKGRNPRFCSLICFGKFRKGIPLKLGNKGKSTQGYVRVNIGANKRQVEHRKVMEEHLGRELEYNEIVHHIDGDKTNNNLNNLELMARGDHCRLHRPHQFHRN